MSDQAMTAALRESARRLRAEAGRAAEYEHASCDCDVADLRERLADALDQLAAAEGEIQSVDARLARRPALADCTSRADMVERACAVAGRAEQAESRLAVVRTKAKDLHAELQRAWNGDLPADESLGNSVRLSADLLALLALSPIGRAQLHRARAADTGERAARNAEEAVCYAREGKAAGAAYYADRAYQLGREAAHWAGLALIIEEEWEL